MLSLLLRLLLFVQLLCHFFNTLLTNAKLPETNRRKLPRRIALKVSIYCKVGTRQVYQVFKPSFQQQQLAMIIKSSQLFHWLQLLGLPAPIFPSDRHYYWWCIVHTHSTYTSAVDVRPNGISSAGKASTDPPRTILSRTKTSIENCYYYLPSTANC